VLTREQEQMTKDMRHGGRLSGGEAQPAAVEHAMRVERLLQTLLDTDQHGGLGLKKRQAGHRAAGKPGGMSAQGPDLAAQVGRGLVARP